MEKFFFFFFFAKLFMSEIIEIDSKGILKDKSRKVVDYIYFQI